MVISKMMTTPLVRRHAATNGQVILKFGCRVPSVPDHRVRFSGRRAGRSERRSNMFGFVHRFRMGIFLALAAVGLSLTAGCGGNSSKSKEVVVGSLLALSGPDQSFGVTQRRGMEIALDEVNAAGGINGRPLKIEYADTKLQEDL